MKQIRFVASGANTLIGGYSAGDVARVSDELATHLVADVKCAEFVVQKRVETPEIEPKQAIPEQKTRRSAQK